MRFVWTTSFDHKAKVASKVQVTRMQHGRCAQWMGQDCGLAVVDHHLGWNAMEVFEGVLVAGQKVFLCLGQGELDIHPAAVTEYHNKKGEPPSRAAHR